eukprot:4737931-Alexandrium_andersonii.AAC.1
MCIRDRARGVADAGSGAAQANRRARPPGGGSPGGPPGGGSSSGRGASGDREGVPPRSRHGT